MAERFLFLGKKAIPVRTVCSRVIVRPETPIAGAFTVLRHTASLRHTAGSTSVPARSLSHA